MIDPDTNQTVLITSNLDLSLDEKDKTKTDLSSLCIRDVTIKSELLSTKTMMTADFNRPITSQIDLASRSLAGTKLDHSQCFIAADALATWKK